MSEQERIYDDLVRPLMSQIIDICRLHGIDFHASFELTGEDDQGLVVTTNINHANSVRLRVMNYAAKAGSNVDALIMAICRDAKQNGHSSAALSILGVPAS